MFKFFIHVWHFGPTKVELKTRKKTCVGDALTRFNEKSEGQLQHWRCIALFETLV